MVVDDSATGANAPPRRSAQPRRRSDGALPVAGAIVVRLGPRARRDGTQRRTHRGTSLGGGGGPRVVARFARIGRCPFRRRSRRRSGEGAGTGRRAIAARADDDGCVGGPVVGGGAFRRRARPCANGRAARPRIRPGMADGHALVGPPRTPRRGTDVSAGIDAHPTRRPAWLAETRTLVARKRARNGSTGRARYRHPARSAEHRSARPESRTAGRTRTLRRGARSGTACGTRYRTAARSPGPCGMG